MILFTVHVSVSVTGNTLKMVRYKSVVFISKDLYEGEEQSFEDKAIASAARVALGNLGYDNGSHISNDTILSEHRNHALSATQFRPSTCINFSRS